MMMTRKITDEMIHEDVMHDATRGSRDGEKSQMTDLRVERDASRACVQREIDTAEDTYISP